MSSALTIGEHLTHLLPRLKRRRTAPAWPPDVFALSMSLIQKSGAYASVLNSWPPKSRSKSSWDKRMTVLGRKWRRAANRKGALAPSFIQERWQVIRKVFSAPIESIRNSPEVAIALFELAALADEACAGVGFVSIGGFEKEYREFYTRARDAVFPKKTGSTLCLEIAPSRVRVLPKQHAPSKGLTVRSLSHHLALCCADEICPIWEAVLNKFESKESLNLLVIPWPEVVKPIQFCPTGIDKAGMKNMPNAFGFFTYKTKSLESDVDDFLVKVEDLYTEARKSLGKIDGIVFPELSMTPDQFESLRSIKKINRSFIVAGIAQETSENSEFGCNQVYLDIPFHGRLEQSKHHRWKLDSSQINQYGLGSRLNPERSWWEHIDIGSRKLNFVALLPWLTMSAVICEDLARPDPVGDLIRSVGPNLVIALLMDGPQIKERWSARYASTLAEDPGCSVLSLTSIGMSALSRPSTGVNRSRVVGLWKDAESSAPVEIELPIGHSAVVLSLSVRWKTEWTADGRCDGGATGYPLLSGIHPIRLPEGVD